jgi:hypothetical protein
VTGADDALLVELRLRSRLNALVHERAEAIREAERLTARGTLEGAQASMSETAERWRTVADEVAGQIEQQRAALRKQEAEVARLRAPSNASSPGGASAPDVPSDPSA